MKHPGLDCCAEREYHPSRSYYCSFREHVPTKSTETNSFTLVSYSVQGSVAVLVVRWVGVMAEL